MIQFDKGAKFSDVITKNMISEWVDDVIFNGGTGTGKTYFILNSLSEYCRPLNKKILFLCNRITLQEEVKESVQSHGLSGIVDVMTYQKIEHTLLQGKEIETKYDYIACDEFHHVNEIYNVYTDLSFKWVLDHSAIKIYMSATCTYIFNIFNNKGIVPDNQTYYIPKDYSYVDKLHFFSRNETIEDIIEDKLINTNDKIIFFANNLDRAIELYKKFKKYSSFFCSIHSRKGAKYITENCITNHTFDTRILIATKALDVGITLLDRDIKHIITDMFDIDTLIQCMGRKRIIDQEDTCNFYIKNHKGNHMKGNKTRLLHIKNPIEMLIKDYDKFISTYANNRKFHNDYIYKDGETYKYNKIAYLRLLRMINDIDIMQGWTKETDNKKYYISGKGYKNFLLEQLGDTVMNIEDMDEIEREREQETLEKYIKSLIGIPLLREQREELIERISLKDSRGRIQRTLGALNGYLINNFNLTIQIKSIKVDGKRKTSWILVSI